MLHRTDRASDFQTGAWDDDRGAWSYNEWRTGKVVGGQAIASSAVMIDVFEHGKVTAMADEDKKTSIPLDGLDDGRRALVELLQNLRRTLYLYTPVVRPELYDDPEVLAAIRGRVVSQSKIRLHWLLPPAREWRSACPRLVQLSERLTTALILRTPNREESPNRPELGQAFAIADESSLLRFNDPRRLLGEYDAQPGERMKELLELFQVLWSRAQADSDLRRLGI